MMTTKSLAKINVNSPQSLANFATELKEFIVKKKLYVSIQNKNYVLVEGWEFAGASMGIWPIVRETIDLSEDGERKYKSRVELVVLSTGKIMGAGEAICSSKERGKAGNEEYSILSMAQTRAIGKAYRNAFGWLMKMAGYESTTAEEARYNETQQSQEPEVMTEPIEEVKARAKAKLDSLGSVERIKAIKVTGELDLKKFTEVNWRSLDAYFDEQDARS